MSKFVIVLEHALDHVEAIGPFDHEEDASTYAHEKFGRHSMLNVWRLAQLLPPEASE